MSYTIHIQHDSGPNPIQVFDEASARGQNFTKVGHLRWLFNEVIIEVDRVELEGHFDSLVYIKTVNELQAQRVISYLISDDTTLSVEETDYSISFIVTNNQEMFRELVSSGEHVVDAKEFAEMSEAQLGRFYDSLFTNPVEPEIVYVDNRQENEWLFSKIESQDGENIRIRLIALGDSISPKVIIEEFLSVGSYQKLPTGYLSFSSEDSSSSAYVEEYPLVEGNGVLISLGIQSTPSRIEMEFLNLAGERWNELDFENIYLEMQNDGDSDVFPVWPIVRSGSGFEKGKLTTLTISDIY